QPGLVASDADIYRERTRRKDTHVCMWTAAWHQLTAQIVQELTQRIGDIDTRAKTFNPPPHNPVRGTPFELLQPMLTLCYRFEAALRSSAKPQRLLLTSEKHVLRPPA